MTSKGFTLVELMVVLVILGLLMTLAPMALNRALPSLEVKASSRNLAAAMRQARSTAIRDNRETAFTLNVETKRYRLAGEEGERELPEEIELKLLTATTEVDDQGNGRIRFFPDGTSTGGRVTLSRDDTTYYILVDWLSGRVRIVDQLEE